MSMKHAKLSKAAEARIREDLDKLAQAKFHRQTRSQLYIVATQAAGPVKLGISTCPSARVKQLQTGNPWPLRVWALGAGRKVLEGRGAQTFDQSCVESAIHDALHRYRLEGEWFDLSVEKAMRLTSSVFCRWHGDIRVHWDIDKEDAAPTPTQHPAPRGSVFMPHVPVRVVTERCYA